MAMARFLAKKEWLPASRAISRDDTTRSNGSMQMATVASPGTSDPLRGKRAPHAAQRESPSVMACGAIAS